MITDSNFYTLTHSRLPKSEQVKRLQHLEHTLAQLQQYHKVCKRLKRPIVFTLIAKYESFIEKGN